MAEAHLTHNTAEVNLKRALGFVEEVENATEAFRKRAIAHDAQINSDAPFLQGVLSTIRGSRDLRQQKTALFNDSAIS